MVIFLPLKQTVRSERMTRSGVLYTVTNPKTNLFASGEIKNINFCLKLPVKLVILK